MTSVNYLGCEQVQACANIDMIEGMLEWSVGCSWQKSPTPLSWHNNPPNLLSCWYPPTIWLSDLSYLVLIKWLMFCLVKDSELDRTICTLANEQLTKLNLYRGKPCRNVQNAGGVEQEMVTPPVHKDFFYIIASEHTQTNADFSCLQGQRAENRNHLFSCLLRFVALQTATLTCIHTKRP